MVEIVNYQNNLKLTTEVHPLLTKDVLTLLKNNDIETLNEFLEKPMDDLARKSKLKYKEIALIRKGIVNKHTTNIFTGDEYYSNLFSKSAVISTGIRSLDKLLEGGLYTGQIIEICGKSNSGKSQIFYTLAVNLSQERNQAVYLIDTRNGFRIERIQQIIESRGYNLEEAAPKVEKNIFVEQIFDVNELIFTLKSLHDEIAMKWKHIRVVIIDLFSFIFLPLSFQESRFGFLNYVSNLLNSLAKQRFISVIIINSVSINYTNDNKVIYPDLGQYWFDIPNTRLLMKQNVLNNESYTVEVLKSTRLKQGCITNITINENGVS